MQRHNVDAALDAARLFSFTLFDLSPLELLVRETKRYWDLAAVYRSNAFGANTSSGDAMKAYYAEFLDDLERYDRDGLIELNSRQRRRVPQQISPI